MTIKISREHLFPKICLKSDVQPSLLIALKMKSVLLYVQTSCLSYLGGEKKNKTFLLQFFQCISERNMEFSLLNGQSSASKQILFFFFPSLLHQSESASLKHKMLHRVHRTVKWVVLKGILKLLHFQSPAMSRVANR